MSYSRASSEAPPAPRSPVHIPTKEPLRHTSPGPPIVPNGLKDLPLADTIATVLSPPSKAASIEKEVEKDDGGALLIPAAEKKPLPPVSEPTLTPEEPEPDLDTGDVIEMETFEQILELDEDDTHDFSYGMVVAYFSQASQTFEEMDAALKIQDLEKLSQLGHFLKGSSAALGVVKVQATCESIQHLGKMQENEKAITSAEALAKLTPLLSRVKGEYEVAEKWLKKFYEETPPS